MSAFDVIAGLLVIVLFLILVGHATQIGSKQKVLKPFRGVYQIRSRQYGASVRYIVYKMGSDDWYLLTSFDSEQSARDYIEQHKAAAAKAGQIWEVV